jgi:ankyrin repeat protein
VRRALLIVTLLLALGLATSVGVAWASATMWRGYDLDNPLTNTWFNEPTVELGEVNQWRVAQWTDATLTRRWGWGWRDEWFEDPWEARLRGVTLGSQDRDRTWTDISLPAFSRAQRPPPEEPAAIALFVNALPSFLEREAGWPMRCLRVRWVAGDDRLDTPGERIRGGVLASYWVYPWGSSSFDASMMHWDTEDEHAIPATPMWAGLAINTVAWAAIWFVLVQLAMLPVRLWLRRRWTRRERRGRCAPCGYQLDVADDPITTCPECGTIAGRRPRRAWRGMVVLPALALVLVVAWVAAVGVQRITMAERLPPLHRAAAIGDDQRVRELLAAGALVDTNAPDLRPLNISPMQGARPIEWAAARGHAAVVDALLAAGADPGMVGDQRSPLALALACGHADAAERLLDAGASLVDTPKTTPAPIAIAAWTDDAALLGRMLDRADAAGRGPVPLELFHTTLTGRSNAVQRLVLDRTARTPRAMADQAVFAFRFEDPDLLDALVARGFDPAGASGAFVAYIEQRPDVLEAIEFLHARGVDLAATYGSGTTALHDVAGMAGARDAIARLVELGVPVDAVDANGRTPLHEAALNGRGASVRALLELGADARALDADGRTPRDLWWHAARDAEGSEGVRDLLEAAERTP